MRDTTTERRTSTPNHVPYVKHTPQLPSQLPSGRCTFVMNWIPRRSASLISAARCCGQRRRKYCSPFIELDDSSTYE